MGFNRRYHEAIFQVADFHKALFEHRGEPPVEWATETPFPWCAALEEEEVTAFAGEAFKLVLEAAREEDLDRFERLVERNRLRAEARRAIADAADWL